jgi:hypothetical protein
VTAGNAGDAEPAPALVSDVLQDSSGSETYGDSSNGIGRHVERIEETGGEGTQGAAVAFEEGDAGA